MKRTLIILIGVTVGLLITIGGIHFFVKTIQSNQNKKQETTDKLVKKTAQEIDDFYKWNYIGVKSTEVGRTWRNPASGGLEVDFSIFLENGDEIESTVNWDINNKLLFSLFGNDSQEKPIFKFPEQGEYSSNREDYYLYPEDIKILKKEGFTEKISGNQIKKYLFETYPNKFKN